MEEEFRILEHPADLGIEAWGDSLAQAVRRAVKALSSIMVEPSTVSATENRDVEINADDSGQLLVRLLSEVILRFDADQFVVADLIVREIGDGHLRGVFLGEMLQPEKHLLKLDVKAVTYHQLSLEQKGGRVTLRLFVDI